MNKAESVSELLWFRFLVKGDLQQTKEQILKIILDGVSPVKKIKLDDVSKVVNS